MSLLRSGSELHIQAPPPSPIPTGKGSRSSANATLSEFLAKSLNIPDLALPEAHVPIDANDQVLEEIGYRSIKSGDLESVDHVLMSVRETGMFLISDHGILGEELRSLVQESGSDLERCSGEIGRVRSGSEMEWTRESVEDERYRMFREKMEKIANKLDAIAQNLCYILIQSSGKKQPGKIIDGKESVISMYNHNHTNEVKLDASEKSREQLCDFTLCLTLPLRQSQFLVQSVRGPLHFVAGSHTIIVTLGNRIQEWSQGDFKCISGEVICEPYLHRSQASFCIQLKCLTSDFSFVSEKSSYAISIRDQIVIGLVLSLLYKLFAFLFS